VILDRGIRIEYAAAAKRRRKANPFMRSWIRCKGMADGYDTDEESHAQFAQLPDYELGTKTPPPMPSGLVPLDFGGEVNDHGEESYYRAKMLSRALRRLDRWEGGGGGGAGRKSSSAASRARNKRLADVGNDAGRPVLDSGDEDDEDDDADLMDVDDLERREALEDESADETDDDVDMDGDVGAGRRWDASTLPPLGSIA
jgi:Ino eighty subunit 1